MATRVTSQMCRGKGSAIDYALPEPHSVLAQVATLMLLIAMGATASAQDSDNTVSEFWPELDAKVQLPDNWRLEGFVGLKKGEDFPYQQLYAGVGLGYQRKRINRPHPENIDPDKEHTFVFGGGYERLQTVSSRTTSYENRMVLQVVAGFRPASRLLLSDRNRVEFRWVNGVYSTRYRNLVQGEYDLKIHEFRFSPYASAEFFYSSTTSSWNQEWYTAGIEWPYKRILMVQTYYLRQNCTNCNPANLNVGGLTLSFFF